MMKRFMTAAGVLLLCAAGFLWVAGLAVLIVVKDFPVGAVIIATAGGALVGGIVLIRET